MSRRSMLRIAAFASSVVASTPTAFPRNRPAADTRSKDRPQAQRVGHPPRDPTLRRQSLEVADEQHPEIPSRTQTQPNPSAPRRTPSTAPRRTRRTRPLPGSGSDARRTDVPRSSANPPSSPTAATPVALQVSCPSPWDFSVRVLLRQNQAGSATFRPQAAESPNLPAATPGTVPSDLRRDLSPLRKLLIRHHQV